MLERIIALSIRFRWIVMALVLLACAVGVWSFQRLPIDATPDITNVQVQINTEAPGFSPLESRPASERPGRRSARPAPCPSARRRRRIRTPGTTCRRWARPRRRRPCRRDMTCRPCRAASSRPPPARRTRTPGTTCRRCGRPRPRRPCRRDMTCRPCRAANSRPPPVSRIPTPGTTWR
ncbi:efflux RND transporter permease subunit [Brevundimonas diminuta]|uniref:efflux RND transporter permease subunit n=1 Tax=Brevundimonas diminuta TaxID=293 RepID=UPI004044EFB4